MDTTIDGTILLICGPPASGKDTITARLSKLDNRFCHFQKHRGMDEVIPNNKASSQYINISKKAFEDKITQDEFLQYHQRYDRYYGISQSELIRNFDNGKIPIIHVGRIENLMELVNKLNKFGKLNKLFIWAPLPILENRLKIRHSGDQTEIGRRLKAAIEEFNDLTGINVRKTFNYIFMNDQKTEQAGQKLFKILQQEQAIEEEAKKLEQYITEYYQ